VFLTAATAAAIVSALTGGTGMPSAATAVEYLVGDKEDENYQKDIFHGAFS